MAKRSDEMVLSQLAAESGRDDEAATETSAEDARGITDDEDDDFDDDDDEDLEDDEDEDSDDL